MKIKNLIISCALALCAITLTIKSEAQSVIVGGYPIFVGSFQHAGPVADNVGSSNALLRVANPLTIGGTLYTNPAVQGYLKVNIAATNNSIVWLTNITTGDVTILGSTATATNYVSATIRVAPSDVVQVTNALGTATLLSSEWRN